MGTAVRSIAHTIDTFASRLNGGPPPPGDENYKSHFVFGYTLSPGIRELVVKSMLHDVNCILRRHNRLDLFLDEDVVQEIIRELAAEDPDSDYEDSDYED